MHLPDGFIDGKTAVTTAALSGIGLAWALRQIKGRFPPQKIPLLGLSAAFLFAAQMVNFPVIGGTSGHLVGGALVAALLGPSAAIIAVTTVLFVQCFLFADGGVLALGANIFNMALIGSATGYAIYRLISWGLPGVRGRVTAIAFAGWCSTVLASISCAGQLAWSGTISWELGLRAMASVHMLIGIGEGLISGLVLAAILRIRPETIVEQRSAVGARWREGIGFGFLVVLGLAVFVAPFACPWPDGLESVARGFGFARKASPPLFPAPIADYHFAGIKWAIPSIAAAAVLGTVVVFGLAWLLGRLLVPISASAARSNVHILNSPS